MLLESGKDAKKAETRVEELHVVASMILERDKCVGPCDNKAEVELPRQSKMMKYNDVEPFSEENIGLSKVLQLCSLSI